MQEEMAQRTVAIMIRGAEFSASTLKKSIQAIGGKVKKDVQQSLQVETKGRQSLKSLQKDKSSLSTIDLSKKNLGGFERIAKKYGLDYSLVRDKASETPNYILFFKGKDEAVMQAAFREFAHKQHGEKEKRSVRREIREIKKHPERYQNKSRNRNKNKKKVKVKKKEIAR